MKTQGQINEPEKLHRTPGKPVTKGHAEEKYNTQQIKNLQKYKKIMNVYLKLRDEEALRKKKWPTDSYVPLEVKYDED